MVDEKDLVRNVESCIEDLKEKFSKYPEWDDDKKEKLSFFGEKYLHYILYKMLKKEKIEEDVMWEWPEYVPSNKKRRGHFDLGIGIWKQNPTIAIEFFYQPESDYPVERFLGLEGKNGAKEHVRRDAKKLCYRENKISHAYILCFILKTAEGNKNYENTKNNFKEYLKSSFEEEQKNQSLQILFIEVDEYKREKGVKPFLDEVWFK